MSSELGYTALGQPRQRMAFACAACRKRKVRCSGEQPACAPCQKSRLPCIYKKSKDQTNQEAERLAESLANLAPVRPVRDAPPVVWYDEDGNVHQRLRWACSLCRMKKARCSGDFPQCASCLKLGVACSYEPRKRKAHDDISAQNGEPRVIRRRRKRDRVTGELLPLSDHEEDDMPSQSHKIKRRRRKRNPLTGELMPLSDRDDDHQYGDVAGNGFHHEVPPPQGSGWNPYTHPQGPGTQIQTTQRPPVIGRQPRNTACTQCKRKKMRCIGEELPCQPCITARCPCIPQGATLEEMPEEYLAQERTRLQQSKYSLPSFQQPRRRQPVESESASPNTQLEREMAASQEQGQDRPHVCRECNKTFTRREHLKRHISIHTGDKAFVCKVPACGREFYRADQLLRHSRSHGEEGQRISMGVYPRKKRVNNNSRNNAQANVPSSPRMCYGCDKQFPTPGDFYGHWPCFETGAAKLGDQPPPSTKERQTLKWCGACGRAFGDRNEHDAHLPCERAKTDFGDFVSQLQQAAN